MRWLNNFLFNYSSKIVFEKDSANKQALPNAPKAASGVPQARISRPAKPTPQDQQQSTKQS
jgi:hypothetical protein